MVDANVPTRPKCNQKDANLLFESRCIKSTLGLLFNMFSKLLVFFAASIEMFSSNENCRDHVDKRICKNTLTLKLTAAVNKKVAIK